MMTVTPLPPLLNVPSCQRERVCVSERERDIEYEGECVCECERECPDDLDAPRAAVECAVLPERESVCERERER